MYAAAGLGWMMFLTVPPIIASFLSVISQTRVKVLKASQNKILDEWGQKLQNNSETNIDGNGIDAEHTDGSEQPVTKEGS